MPAHRTGRWCLLVASAVLTACAGSPRQSTRKDLRLDTETVSRVRHAASVGNAARGVGATASRAVASDLGWLAPILLTLLENDDKVSDFEEQLVDCARQAERKVNAEHFGNRSPTREECGEEVQVDGCVEPITRAMLLGQQKHVLALQCAHEVLTQSWPAPFSIEQRYRYYHNAKFIETVNQREEARLIAQRCTLELWRTIKPDIVLHADHNPLKSVLTLDFKFPCPDTNKPRWTQYGDKSAYAGTNQGKVYKDALGAEAMIISPKGFVIP